METNDAKQWNGLKLRNPPGTNLCYLNTALNCLGINSKLKVMFNNECHGLKELSKKNILNEAKNLFLRNGRIGDASKLRELLQKKFKRFEQGEQNDAADAFLSLLECVTGAKNFVASDYTLSKHARSAG